VCGNIIYQLVNLFLQSSFAQRQWCSDQRSSNAIHGQRPPCWRQNFAESWQRK